VHLEYSTSAIAGISTFPGDGAESADKRGSALLATLCFAAVLILSLSSYIAVCYRSLYLSNRDMQSSRSIQLAEAGMEEALWALTNNTWTGWTLTTISGVPTATKTVTGFSFENGATGQATLTVSHYDLTTASFTSGSTSTITLTSAGKINLADGTSVTRTLQSNAQPSPLFTNAIGLSGALTFNSTAISTIDSFNSHPAPTYNLTAYTTTNPAHLTTSNSSAVVSSATAYLQYVDIYGYAATNGSSGLSYGSSTEVIGPNTPNGTTIDSTLLSTNSYQPTLTPLGPTGGSNLYDPVTGSSTLTHSISGGLGTAGATSPTIYRLNAISLSGTTKLTINGPVVLVVNNSVQTSGSAEIRIKSTGSLQIQLNENSGTGLNLQGDGILNQTSDPQKLIVQIGQGATLPSTSVINTTQPFYGTLYLPNDTISVSGNFTMYGSMVAKNVTFNAGSSASIHYDSSLQSIGFSGFSASAFSLVFLHEL
jgi:hypothetical protein